MLIEGDRKERSDHDYYFLGLNIKNKMIKGKQSFDFLPFLQTNVYVMIMMVVNSKENNPQISTSHYNDMYGLVEHVCDIQR